MSLNVIIYRLQITHSRSKVHKATFYYSRSKVHKADLKFIKQPLTRYTLRLYVRLRYTLHITRAFAADLKFIKQIITQIIKQIKQII